MNSEQNQGEVNPLQAMTLGLIVECTRDISGVSLALRDVCTSVGMRDVFDQFYDDQGDCLVVMLRTVMALKTPTDTSTYIPAPKLVQRLRENIERYASAFELGHAAHHILTVVYPEKVCATFATMDLAWRSLLGIVSKAVPDEHSFRITEAMRGILEDGTTEVFIPVLASLRAEPSESWVIALFISLDDEWRQLQRDGMSADDAWAAVGETAAKVANKIVGNAPPV